MATSPGQIISECMFLKIEQENYLFLNLFMLEEMMLKQKKKSIKELTEEYHKNLVHYKEIFEYKDYSVIVLEL
jgi:hypothetical protein